MEKLILFACGALHIALYPDFPPRYLFPALFFVSGIFAFINCGKAVNKIAGATAAFLLGAFFGQMHLSYIISGQLPKSCDNSDHKIHFLIERIEPSLASELRPIARLKARVTEIESSSNGGCFPDPEWLIGKQIKLSWYGSPKLKLNQEWMSTVRLKRPRGTVNPGGFDYQAWLLAEGYAATGYVKNKLRHNLINQTPLSAFKRYRQGIQQYLLNSELQSSRFFLALAVGEKSLITSADWRVLQKTGTIHLMAISGLHVGFIAWFGYILGVFVGKIAVLNRQLQDGILMRFFPPLLSCLFAAFYAALASFSIPTQRALVAVVIVNYCLCLGIKINRLQALALVFAVVSLINPFAILNSGFWLSFLAVFCLFLCFSGRREQGGKLRKLIKMQFVLALGLAVPLWVLGQNISLVAPLANLVAVPVVTVVIVPFLLVASALSVAFDFGFILFLLDEIFLWLWEGLTQLADFEYANWSPSRHLSWMLICAIVISNLLILVPKGVIKPYLPASVLVALALSHEAGRDLLTLTVLDVGQGLSVVIQTPENTAVYDTGAHFSDRFNVGERIVSPFLRQNGIREFHLLVSHNDNDHSGGTEPLLRNFSVTKLTRGEVSDQPESAGEPCQQGQRWRQGVIEFSVLWPDATASYSGNNASCVILLQFGNKRILLMGDIEAEIEKKLLLQGVLPRDIELLIAPHHGSISSSTSALVKHLRPRHVVFSTGYNNSFGHPNVKVVERYRRVQSRLYNTATDGALQFRWLSLGSDAQITAERHQRSRVWY